MGLVYRRCVEHTTQRARLAASPTLAKDDMAAIEPPGLQVGISNMCQL